MNWTVAQWSKVLFSNESKFCISFGNQGPRVWRKGGEAHSPSCLKSSVKFPQSEQKMNWTVAQWSKVLFSNESKFCISFGNQGPRVWRKGGEAHSPSCLKSSVKFPQSVMIWGAM